LKYRNNINDLVVIDAELGRKNHGSIPHNYDCEGAEIIWCQNRSPNQIKLVVKAKKRKKNYNWNCRDTYNLCVVLTLKCLIRLDDIFFSLFFFLFAMLSESNNIVWNYWQNVEFFPAGCTKVWWIVNRFR
jgi:hypothetical protein